MGRIESERSPLNVIEFRRRDFKFGDDRRPTEVIQIVIDGRDLAGRLGLPQKPGIPVELMRKAPRHWLGSPAPFASENGRPLVLGCECGSWECGGTLVEVELTPDYVEWHGFFGPFSDEAFSDDTFRFNQAQFENALSVIESA